MIANFLRAASLFLVAGSLVAGCGGSDESSTPSQATATPQAAAASSTPTSTPTVDAAADKEATQQALLRLEDFPSGWTQADDDDERNTSKCPTVEDVKKQTTARATARSFSEGETTQLQNSVYLFADEAVAGEAFVQITRKDTRSCYAETVGEALAEAGGLEVGEVRSARLSIDPLGDERDAARITVPVKAEGVDLEVIVDMVFVRAARGLTLTLFIDVLTPFDADLRDELTATSVRRLSETVQSK